MNTRQALFSLAPALLIIAVTAYFAFADFNKAVDTADSWMKPVISKNEVAALKWVVENTPERTVFATDIFGGELLMSVLREGTEGGDWAIVPNVVKRMHDAQYGVYGANSSETAWNTAREYNASYVWVPDRTIFAGFEWKYPDSRIFEDEKYFEKVFDNGHEVYRVKNA
ncbi:MAG TPA: hypothetical protein VJI71_02935 [Candidatus Norongarragalinales archaeon]|nr:hypothetical protein [Candidatus Norongarragalinales archaeon]